MKIVHYIKAVFPPVVGQSAFLYPVDHPDTENVSNTTAARTSAVQALDEVSGVIVTQNTVYVPVIIHQSNL